MFNNVVGRYVCVINPIENNQVSTEMREEHSCELRMPCYPFIIFLLLIFSVSSFLSRQKRELI